MQLNNLIARTDDPARPIKALLLDDSAFDRSRIRRMTEKSALQINFDEATSIEAMSQKMDDDVFDLILIDFQLPEGDGLQALEVVQSHPTNKSAAKIMITGQEPTEIAISAFRQGCHDFITKDELSVAMLRRAMRSSLQQTEFLRFHNELVTSEIQQQIQLAMRTAIEGDMVQSALSLGLMKAAQNIGLEVNNIGKEEKTEAIMLDFLRDDVAGFDFLKTQ